MYRNVQLWNTMKLSLSLAFFYPRVPTVLFKVNIYIV